VDGRGVVSREDDADAGADAGAAAGGGVVRARELPKTLLVSALNSSTSSSSMCSEGRLFAGGCGRGPHSGARSEATVAARVAAPRWEGSVGVATRRGGERGGNGNAASVVVVAAPGRGSGSTSALSSSSWAMRAARLSAGGEGALAAKAKSSVPLSALVGGFIVEGWWWVLRDVCALGVVSRKYL
jgi:hypothetical protein